MRASAQGSITYVGELNTSRNGTQYREIAILETNTEYPKTISFTLFKEKALADYAIGQEIEIEVNIESRASNGRFFTSISAYKVTVIGGTPAYSQPAAQPTVQQQQQHQPSHQQPTMSSSQDLPF